MTASRCVFLSFYSAIFKLNKCEVSDFYLLLKNSSEMETGRVAGRVEILRPAGQAG